MAKYFNITGVCRPSEHYMVNLDGRLAEIRKMIDRKYYFPTFQSVILAGVYDIRNLKQKVRPDSEHKHNSPWNIAAAFDVNMDLEVDGIAGMLAEYEADYHTGMDVRRMAQLLYEETCGYPFLVSRLCQLMDKQIPGSEEFPDRQAAWSRAGLLAAEKILLMEKNTLFDSLTNKLEDYPKLRELFYSMLFLGKGSCIILIMILSSWNPCLAS